MSTQSRVWPLILDLGQLGIVCICIFNCPEYNSQLRIITPNVTMQMQEGTVRQENGASLRPLMRSGASCWQWAGWLWLGLRYESVSDQWSVTSDQTWPVITHWLEISVLLWCGQIQWVLRTLCVSLQSLRAWLSAATGRSLQTGEDIRQLPDNSRPVDILSLSYCYTHAHQKDKSNFFPCRQYLRLARGDHSHNAVPAVSDPVPGASDINASRRRMSNIQPFQPAQ